MRDLKNLLEDIKMHYSESSVTFNFDKEKHSIW